MDGRVELLGTELLKLDCATTLEFSAFPNPVLKDLTINISDPKTVVSQVVLSNDLNQVLYSYAIENRESDFSIDMAPFPAGIYFVHVVNTYKTIIQTKKVIELGN